jgi:hypothetical protein
MTQDEIIEMAKQAGLDDDVFPLDEWEPVELIAFAKLVAAAEREACAKRASIALLGTLQTTADRVLKSIRSGCRDVA